MQPLGGLFSSLVASRGDGRRHSGAAPDSPQRVWTQENVVKPMKRWFVLVSLLLHGLITGCARDTDLRALQADTAALGRQNSERRQTVEVRLQRLSDSITQFEQAQAETRRNLAQVAANLDELRIQLQRLQGDIQETQHQVQRGTTGGEKISAMKLADFETRLRELEKQLGALTP
jgi:septal ring factor EnvC (AmiA/AmiB activator)